MTNRKDLFPLSPLPTPFLLIKRKKKNPNREAQCILLGLVLLQLLQTIGTPLAARGREQSRAARAVRVHRELYILLFNGRTASLRHGRTTRSVTAVPALPCHRAIFNDKMSRISRRAFFLILFSPHPLLALKCFGLRAQPRKHNTRSSAPRPRWPLGGG